MSDAPHESDFHFFAHFDGRPGLFLDVGANHGQSARSLRTANRSFEIISFEPNPELEATLAAVKRELGRGFEYHMFGLGSESERRRLLVPRATDADLSASASLEPTEYLKDHVVERLRDESGAEREFRLSELEVEVRRLDDLGLAPDVVKIDVEGWEWQVLLGGEETLRRYRPIIMLELNNLPPVEKVLLPLGYEAFRYDAAAHGLLPWRQQWEVLNLVYLHVETQRQLREEVPAAFA